MNHNNGLNNYDICRKRHIKCDETKPVCQRCVRFEVSCDGYQSVVAERPKETKKNDSRSLVPKPTNWPFIYRSLSVVLFEDEQEERFYRLFCNKTALQLSGCFDSVLVRELSSLHSSVASLFKFVLN